MTPESLLTLFDQVAKGETSPDAALKALKAFPYQDLGYACLDHHRELRQGSPEVVYAEFKTPDEVVTISQALITQGANVLCTRLQPEAMSALEHSIPEITVHDRSRLATLIQNPKKLPGKVAVLCAGTSDIPVAEEARLTLEFYGIQAYHRYDVGVAGLHRLLNIQDELHDCDTVIVVAGMEGALASVVAGLVAAPVIAVPTSVGYGANLKGVTTLLALVNSCAAGVTVVNIDNGFGAANSAFRTVQRITRSA